MKRERVLIFSFFFPHLQDHSFSFSLFCFFFSIKFLNSFLFFVSIISFHLHYYHQSHPTDDIDCYLDTLSKVKEKEKTIMSKKTEKEEQKNKKLNLLGLIFLQVDPNPKPREDKKGSH